MVEILNCNNLWLHKHHGTYISLVRPTYACICRVQSADFFPFAFILNSNFIVVLFFFFFLLSVRFVRHVHHFYVEFCFKTLPYMVMKLFDRLLRAHSCKRIHTSTRRLLPRSKPIAIASSVYGWRWVKFSPHWAFVIGPIADYSKTLCYIECVWVVCVEADTVEYCQCMRLWWGSFCSYLVALLLNSNRNERFFLHTVASLVV